MQDRDYSKMEVEEIKHLFRSGQLHPGSEEGAKAIQELASRDKRPVAGRTRKVIYGVFIVALIVATVGIIGFILSFGF